MCCGIYPAPGRLCVHHAAGLFSALSDITCRISVRFQPPFCSSSSLPAERSSPPLPAHRQVYPLNNFSICAAARPAHNAYLKYLKYLSIFRSLKALMFKASSFHPAHRWVYFCSSIPILLLIDPYTFCSRSYILCSYHKKGYTCCAVLLIDWYTFTHCRQQPF